MRTSLICLFAVLALSFSQRATAQPPPVVFPGPFVTPGSPFVEDFEDGRSGFGTSDDLIMDDLLDNDVTTGAGGVGGSNQLLTTTSFDAVNAFQGVLFRAEAGLGSSGLAFAGDYVAAGVDELSFTVQHDAPIDLSFGLRFAPAPANFPGGFAIGFDDVARNTPTELAVAINPDNLFNPSAFQFGDLGFFELPDVDPLVQFNTIFSAVGNIQFTVGLPDGFAAVTQADIDTGVAPAAALLGDVFEIDNAGDFVGATLFNTADDITFGLDNVTITAVPEPADLSLMTVAGLAGMFRRRRSR